jgi:hypothetical protein
MLSVISLRYLRDLCASAANWLHKMKSSYCLGFGLVSLFGVSFVSFESFVSFVA